MNITSYVDLVALLELNPATREENRAFSLTHPLLKKQPLAQILAWINAHAIKLKKPRLSETFSHYLYSTTFTLVVISFVLGLFSGLGLLSYNGSEPVNVIYFMAMVIVLPLITMVLTFISMFRVKRTQNALVHLSPAFWMEKILGFFPVKVEENIRAFSLNPLLSNWLIIQRSQLLALFFSFGLLLSLLLMVVTKDIAFAWSTTLHISSAEFQEFLTSVAFPWKDFMPSAVPSIALIEKSHYFRLGEGTLFLDPLVLGEWWKFLAFSTVFYAIFLRILMLLLSSLGFKRALGQSFLILEGSRRLLREMNEAIISTHATSTEENVILEDNVRGQVVHKLDSSYDGIQGWAITKDEILVLSDDLNVLAPIQFKVGGTNSLDDDEEVIAQSSGEVLLFAKAWEHPTNEFLDYVMDLSAKVRKVIVMPVGDSKNFYVPKEEDLDAWALKLTPLRSEKVWLKV